MLVSTLVVMTLLSQANGEPAPAKVRLTFVGITPSQGVTPETAKALGDAVLAEVGGTKVYEILSTTDVERMLGAERQRQLMGCSELESESCMNEIAGALNADRLMSGTVQRADDKVILTLVMTDPKKAREIGRAFRSVEAPGGLAPVIEVLPALVYELVNLDPRLEGRTLKPERGFGGVMIGVRADVDFLGFGGRAVPIAAGIMIEYSGKRFGGVLTVLPKVDFGARIEGRFYPFAVKNLLRPHLGVGTTVLLSGISARGALGATLKLGQLNVFLEVGYEYFFHAWKPPGEVGRHTYLAHAVVAGLGVGWLF